MTDSMVERVGAALSSLPDSSWDDYEWGDLPSGVREGFIEQARAAITAMREPTDALTAALEREEALIAILDDVERGLQEIYSGDEGPILLRTRIVKCARRHEAGKTLRQLISARAALSENKL